MERDDFLDIFHRVLPLCHLRGADYQLSMKVSLEWDWLNLMKKQLSPRRNLKPVLRVSSFRKEELIDFKTISKKRKPTCVSAFNKVNTRKSLPDGWKLLKVGQNNGSQKANVQDEGVETRAVARQEAAAFRLLCRVGVFEKTNMSACNFSRHFINRRDVKWRWKIKI